MSRVARDATSSGAPSYAASAAVIPLGRGLAPSQLLVEPHEGVRPVVRLIDAAQNWILVEIYILTDRTIVRALERAAAQAVRVNVLLEPHPFGMGAQPQRMADELRAAGVAVRWSSSAFALTHAKVLIADGRVALVSTANFSAAAFSSNREFLVEDRNAADVRELSNVLTSDWNRRRPRLGDQELVVSPDSARAQLTALLDHAHRSIQIYAEEMQDPRVERLLVGRAHAHIAVQVILERGQSASDAKRLAEEGVSLRVLSSPYIHAKVILIDGSEAFVGSENPSTQSLDRNREIGVLLRGPAVHQIVSVFVADWTRGAAP